MAGDHRVPGLPSYSGPRDHPRPELHGRGEPPAAPTARRPHASDLQAAAPTCRRPALLAPGAPRPARLASAPGPGRARDGRPMAPSGLAAVLAVAVARSDGSPPR